MLLPGPITGIIGLPGSGKSFYALKCAIRQCEDLKLDHLVCNFSIDESQLFYYCLASGYSYLVGRMRRGGFLICRPTTFGGMQSWLDVPDSLYILDEAGIYLNSRQFSEKNGRSELLNSIAKIRHRNRLLFWIAQYYDQTDRMIRDLTASVVHCDSVTKYSKDLKNLEIKWQKAFLYDIAGWEIYETKIRGKRKGFKALFQQRQVSLYNWLGPLTWQDKIIFEVYSSFGDLDDAESNDCHIINPIKLLPFDFLLRCKNPDLNSLVAHFHSEKDFESQQQDNSTDTQGGISAWI